MSNPRVTRGLPAGFRALRAIFLKELRHYLRYPGEIFMLFLIPYLFTTIISAMGSFVGGANAAQNFVANTGANHPFIYQVLGAAVWMISWLIIEDIGTAVRNDQLRGTLEQNLLTPVRRPLFLAAMALAHILIGLAIFVAVIAVTVGLFAPANAAQLLQAMFILLLGSVPQFGIGFLLAGLVIRFKEPQAFVNALNILFGVITGTYYPVTILPLWVQGVAWAIPQTHVIQNMRLILDANAALVQVYGGIIVLLAMALAYPMVGYRIFSLFEGRAKRTGDLSKF